MCKNRGIYGFLGTSWVLINCNILVRPPGNNHLTYYEGYIIIRT